jgi:Xaa-Pro dipeptidase
VPQDPQQSRFLVRGALERFMAMGGVRIEDNVLVTEGGARSLTSVPRSVEEIEGVMAGGSWQARH